MPGLSDLVSPVTDHVLKLWNALIAQGLLSPTCTPRGLPLVLPLVLSLADFRWMIGVIGSYIFLFTVYLKTLDPHPL